MTAEPPDADWHGLTNTDLHGQLQTRTNKDSQDVLPETGNGAPFTATPGNGFPSVAERVVDSALAPDPAGSTGGPPAGSHRVVGRRECPGGWRIRGSR